MATGHKWYKPFQPFHMLHAFAAIILHNALKPCNLKQAKSPPLWNVWNSCTGRLKTHHQYPLEQPRIVRSNKWLWQFKLSLMGIMGVGRVLRQVNIVSKHSCPGVSNSPKLRSICCFQDEHPTVKNWQSNSGNSNRGQFRWVEVSLDPLSGPRVKFQHKIIFQTLTCHLPQNLTLSLVK